MNKSKRWAKRKKVDYRSEFEKKGKPVYLEMSDGAKVRVLDFNLAENPKGTILFVPGFITVFQSFEAVLKILVKDFRIHYFESREKISSIVVNNKTITVQRSAEDIKEVVEKLGLNKTNDYFVVSSSYGGTLLLENLSRDWIQPKFAVLIGPTVEMKMTWLAIPLMKVAYYFRGPIAKFLVRTYINICYVDRKRDVAQRQKYMRAVFENCPRKYFLATKQMRVYKGWDLLPKVKTKCLIVGESKDKMHYCSEKVAELIPDAVLVDLETNEATHSKPLVDILYEYIQNTTVELLPN